MYLSPFNILPKDAFCDKDNVRIVVLRLLAGINFNYNFLIKFFNRVFKGKISL